MFARLRPHSSSLLLLNNKIILNANCLIFLGVNYNSDIRVDWYGNCGWYLLLYDILNFNCCFWGRCSGN